MKADVTVLGAGMVGVSTALALQARGRNVVLVDRQAPGREASFGNAGIIQAEAVRPYGFPFNPRLLAEIATGRSSVVKWNLRGVVGSARPLASYIRHSLPGRHKDITGQYAPMVRQATRDHQALIEAANAENLIDKKGFIEAFRSPGNLNQANREAEWSRTEYGVPFEVYDGDGLADAEPGLLERMAGAIHWTDSWSCRDPGGLVEAYAALFLANGGHIERADAETLRMDNGTWTVANDDSHEVRAATVVIALGAWSAGFLARFGYRIPMVLKRGYHRHLTTANGPRLPFVDAERAIVLAPMAQGLRVLTGAELTPIDGPQNFYQVEAATRTAEELFAARIPSADVIWHGTRPCMPNMLPVVAPAQNHAGMWFHFGHGHQGFTLGPTTARILADRMDGVSSQQ